VSMEYVPGQDLKGLIRQSGRLAIGITISIAKKVYEGLAEAMIYLADNGSTLKSMARKSYKRYKEFYTAKKSKELLTKNLMKALVN